MPVDYTAARSVLDERFRQVHEAYVHGQDLPDPLGAATAWDAIFASKTQAYREVLLGCLLARIVDRSRDIHLPYVRMGDAAFSGRSLDEKVVNPFLRENSIPCSGGPYLSVFRRQVRFDSRTRQGVKDKEGYDALCVLLDAIAALSDDQRLLQTLDHLLGRFVLLREQARVQVARLDRVSVEQYRHLISGLLRRPSGGTFPLVLSVAMIETLSSRFALGWQVESHGINVADRASGAGGDIVIRENSDVILTVEVTERPLDAGRVRATFAEKIMQERPADYVFLVHLATADAQARLLIEKYFAQGYDISAVDLSEWLICSLTTVGSSGRRDFHTRVVNRLSEEGTPMHLRVAWNQEIADLIG